ncbi:hypothetical protein NPIL_120221 [Nephila pilipes]|uniref:Uncharacterized protein n=1 Tax=Nephila pilipes TaxID=299642 RepID=A0A8X6JXJ9_NEPPI|nr:hypothetical protein NPIL_120221 [Nephila pilipes]
MAAMNKWFWDFLHLEQFHLKITAANKRIISIAGAYHDVILEELNRYDLTIHNNNFKDTYNCHHKRS